jgi:hypothetical protein
MFNVHGVTVKLETNEDSFLDFVSGNYKSFECDQAPESIRIRADFRRGKSISTSARHRGQAKTGLRRIGHNISVFDNGVVADFGSTFIRVAYDGTLLKVESEFAKSLMFQIREITRSRSYIFERYQEFMRLVVHFPVFWILAKRGLNLLHGSAVDHCGRSLLFLGLNGSGKTTLAASLLEDCRLMSDNFILFDREFVYGFPECLRLPYRPDSLMSGSSVGPRIFGKYHWRPPPEKISLKSKPWKVFLVQIGSDFSMRPMGKREALKTILAMNDYLHEFQYYSYLNFLGVEMREESYASFSDEADFYELTVKKGEPGRLEAVRELSRLIQ